MTLLRIRWYCNACGSRWLLITARRLMPLREPCPFCGSKRTNGRTDPDGAAKGPAPPADN
jgi:hypothetical protein